jgi:hypothetical protein
MLLLVILQAQLLLGHSMYATYAGFGICLAHRRVHVAKMPCFGMYSMGSSRVEA